MISVGLIAVDSLDCLKPQIASHIALLSYARMSWLIIRFLSRRSIK